MGRQFVMQMDDRPGELAHLARALGSRGFLEGQTIEVEVEDKPGGLADVAERLAAADVNILGTLVVGRRERVVEMAFAVDDAEKVQLAVGPTARM